MATTTWHLFDQDGYWIGDIDVDDRLGVPDLRMGNRYLGAPAALRYFLAEGRWSRTMRPGTPTTTDASGQPKPILDLSVSGVGATATVTLPPVLGVTIKL